MTGVFYLLFNKVFSKLKKNFNITDTRFNLNNQIFFGKHKGLFTYHSGCSM